MNSKNTKTKVKKCKEKDPKVEKRDVQFLWSIDAFHLMLSTRIREAREAAHYSRKELALLVGFKGTKTIERMETHTMHTDPMTGKTVHTYKWVKSSALIEVCHILDVNIAEIWDSVISGSDI